MANGFIICDDGTVQQFGQITRADILLSLLTELTKQLKVFEKEQLEKRLRELHDEE